MGFSRCPGRLRNLPRVLDVLKTLDADVVALQARNLPPEK